MIIKGKARGDAVALGRYLLTSRNEHVEVLSVDGFLANDVMGAMRETEAIAKAGVKSKQYLFSLSLSPPPHETVGVEVYENAITRIKDSVGLSGAPHVALFHENGGRRHMHLVVSRIDPMSLTVKPLPHWKNKLNAVSKELFLENGFDLPAGFIDKRQRDPRNFTFAEFKQAQREGLDRRYMSMAAMESWAISKDKDDFISAMAARGLFVAKGDRRDNVALSYGGEVHALSRLLGRKVKEVRDRLGDGSDLRSIEETRTHIRDTIAPMLQGHLDAVRQEKMREMTPLDEKRLAMTTAHRLQRDRLETGLAARERQENQDRADRLQSGVSGLWQKLSGKAAKIIEQNQAEAWEALKRSRTQRQELIEAQRQDRRELEKEIVACRERHFARQAEIFRELMTVRGQETPQQAFKRMAEQSRPTSTPPALRPDSGDRQAAFKQKTQSRPAQDRGGMPDTGRSPGHDLER